MKIEIRDTDHARLTKLAERRGETDVSRLVCDALSSYLDVQEREQAPEASQAPAKKKSRWAEAARRHQENPTLTGKAEEVNVLIHEFRREFAV